MEPRTNKRDTRSSMSLFTFGLIVKQISGTVIHHHVKFRVNLNNYLWVEVKLTLTLELKSVKIGRARIRI